MGGNSVAWAAVIAPTLEETPLTHLGEAQGKIVHMPLFAAVPVILHLSELQGSLHQTALQI